MRKNNFGRRLKRDKNERQALFKGLLSALVLKERIQTTEAKAKAIRADADKLITKARKESRLARKLLEKKLSPQAIEKLLTDIAPRFADRKGGYTRIMRLNRRFGDDAQVVILEWVELGSKEKLGEQAGDVKKEKNIKIDKKTNRVKKESKKAKPKIKKAVKNEKRTK